MPEGKPADGDGQGGATTTVPDETQRQKPDAAAIHQSCDVNPDTDGLVAWQAVLLENWPRITEHQQKPSARRVMRWLRDNGPSDVFFKDLSLRESLCWKDSYGQCHTLTLKRLGTVLSEWRKKGTLPV